MKYFFDTEFIEDGKTIDLISIGIVAEDGREFYACNRECNFSKASEWVWVNVLEPIGVEKGPCGGAMRPVDPRVWKTRKQIAQDIIDFVFPDWDYRSKKESEGVDFTPEFWAEWCAYDWVVFCQLFGTMMDLPKNFPMRCRDVIQYAEDHLEISSDLLPPSLETDGNHNALLGAKTVHLRYEYLQKHKRNLEP